MGGAASALLAAYAAREAGPELQPQLACHLLRTVRPSWSHLGQPQPASVQCLALHPGDGAEEFVRWRIGGWRRFLVPLWCLCFDAACGASTSAAASELASELNASEEDSREDGSFCELTCFWVVWLGPSPLAFFSASCRSLTCCRASLCLATRSASAADRGVAGLILKSSSGFSAKSGEDLLGVSFRGDALSAFSSSWLSFMMVVADILQVANV